MKFDNKDFEAGVKQTLNSLSNLKKGLTMEGATKGLHDVAAAAKNFTFDHITAGIEGVSNRFRALSIVGITALQNITNQAIFAGQNLVKSLTIDPIKTGLSEYETNLNSIQTILANTAWQKTGLNDVNKALGELNEYSDQTIYNFAEMARNIGTFTAAGVKLDTATEAIKGIANLAAISGSNSQQAATAMYQLSQALAAGRVTLMDWNSVVNAGMGGKVFQDALMETARIHGVAIDKMVKDSGGFRNTLEKGWLTGEVLTETLSKFTGDLNAAQLKNMGYNAKQIKQILEMGKTAQDAATKVKTMSALINTLQESATSGWAQTWQMLFGDFEEARTLFTSINNVLGGWIKGSADARNKVLGDWKELHGRTVLIEAVKNIFEALISVVKPIKDAFREIFPATTGQELYNLTYLFRSFTEKLKLGSEAAGNLKRTFAGVFAVFGILFDFVKIGISTLFRLFGVVSEGGGSFLEVTAKIGDFLVSLRKAIKEGKVFETFWGVLEAVIKGPLQLIGLISEAVSDLIDRFVETDKATAGIAKLGDKLEPLEGITGFIAKGWKAVLSVLKNVMKFLADGIFNSADFFTEVGTWFKEGFESLSIETLIGGVAVGGIGAIIAKVISWFTGGGPAGILGQVNEVLNSVTGAFESMQNTLRAATLLQIAIAIGVLTLSVMALSKIDSEGLTRALTAMTVMFAQLGGALFLFEKHLKFDDIGKMYAIVGVMAALGIAMRILVGAVKDLAELSWQELATGLLGVTVLLSALILTVERMPDDKKLFATAISLNILALAVKLLASSVIDLAALDWQELARGLLAVGGILGGLLLFTKFAKLETMGVASGVGLILLATGLKIVASAVKDLATLSWEQLGTAMSGLAAGLLLMAASVRLFPPDTIVAALGIIGLAGAISLIASSLVKMKDLTWEQIAKGLVAMAGAITIIGLAVSLVPPTAALSAAGFLVVALSLGKIGEAFEKLSKMSWEEIAKGTVALLGMLGVITAALFLLPAALPGAAALLVVAGALAILTPILVTLGGLSWEEIGKAMATLAGLFLILGVAGAVLGAAVPALLGLGAAIVLIGVGLLAAGVGIAAFSIGLKTLAVLGEDGAKTMELFIMKLLGLIPLVMEQIGLGIIAFAGVIATAGPAITMAITTVLHSMINAIEEITPRVIEVLFKLLVLLLKEMETAVPLMVRSGYKILIGILEGIRDNIEKVVTVALEIIAKFIKGIGNGLPGIIEAGVQLILSFIRGLTKAINDHSKEMGEAGGDLAVAIINGMIKGLGAGIGKIASKAREVAKSALNAAMDVLGINSPSKEFQKIGVWSGEGMALGLDKSSDGVSESAESVGKEAMLSLQKSLSGLAKVAAMGELDLNPKITPVIDLTEVRKNANAIDGLFKLNPITVKASYSGATEAGEGFQNNQEAQNSDDTSSTPPSVSYTQINNSPKALSTGDIYRQTNNQLSATRGAVEPNAVQSRSS
jgi:tape measure domain-containing protein